MFESARIAFAGAFAIRREEDRRELARELASLATGTHDQALAMESRGSRRARELAFAPPDWISPTVSPAFKLWQNNPRNGSMRGDVCSWHETLIVHGHVDFRCWGLNRAASGRR